jgi:exonuclease III
LDFKFTLACIYRSPIGDFYEFFNKLELVICKVCSKGKRLIICGDWNVNFLQDSGKLQKLQNLFLMFSLTNTVNSPTWVTNNMRSLIDVMIINNLKFENLTEVLDFGFSVTWHKL